MGCMVSRLAAKLAFFPPSPPTYQIKKNDDNNNNKVTVESSSSPSMQIPHADDNSLDVLLVDTKRGNKIVCFYLRNPYARLTVLYSHGNAADLGQLYDLFVQLKVNLRVNIIGYDYSGYGASTGEPSESNTYADIEAVYQCLETEYGISQEDLILYGQSVGSGPTLHLAAKLPRLRGVILHSAILSGLRVLCHVKFSFCFDIYKNINKIKKVKCPVLVMHGTEDDVVNWLHGERLWKMAREPYEPLWIKGGGHCNLELYPDYIRHLCKFIQEMENMNTKVRLKKIKQSRNLKKRSCADSPCCSKCCRSPGCSKCCRLNICRPSCLGCCSLCSCSCCSMPKCSSCWMPSCPGCSPCSCSCCSMPKCSSCWMPSCLRCSPCSCSCCSMPKCSSCWMPSCLGCSPCSCSCCSMPKCSSCWMPSCLGCSPCSCSCCSMPKCSSCWTFGCLSCSLPKCMGWKPSCVKCSCQPKCSCRPKCLKCPKLRCPKCLKWLCCMAPQKKVNGKQDG